jgi:CheY-like chemotaxis protein
MGLFDAFQKKPASPPAPPAPKATILVVDDEQYLREFYQELLTQQGYQIYMAANGQEGYDLATKLRPDLILLDIMMPGMSGIEVLSKLEESGLTEKSHVIMLTNAGSMQNMDDAKFHSAYQFLIKANTSPEEVIKTVEGAIRYKLVANQ